MKHHTKAKSHARKKGKKNAPTSSSTAAASRDPWVHRLAFQPLPQPEGVIGANEAATSEADKNDESISVISFNVLADGYCSRNSHRNLPPQFQQVVFDRQRRGSLLRKVLVDSNEYFVATDTASSHQPLRPDVWALQEVDMDDVSKHLRLVGYDGVETPRMKTGGAGGKVDSCGVYFRKEKWTLLDQEIIRFDDLATLLSPKSNLDGAEAENNDAAQSAILRSLGNNLQGLQQSLLRRNMGILVRLQSINSKRTIVVANAHLFWNPAYEYVKLCQAHYLMIRVHAFAKSGEPLIVSGDFNSMPGGSVHSYFTKGKVVDPRKVAPWFHNDYDADNDAVRSGDNATSDDGMEADNFGENDSIDDIEDGISNLAVAPNAKKDISEGVSTESPSECSQLPSKQEAVPRKQQIRYLLDYNLNRLCRWMRILGIDAGLETDAEERLRTKKGEIRLFDRCRNENRVLVTTSTRLLARKDCPPGAYLISTKSIAVGLEAPLAHILLTHGVVLDPSTFLSRCVVCNGSIGTVYDPDEKRKIFADHQAPLDVGDAPLEVYKCDGCGQGYWWCDRPTSSASRVKVQATKLYEMCLRAQVPIVSNAEKNMFWHVDIEEQRRNGWDWSKKGSELLKLNLQVTDWLKMDQLICPRLEMQSAYLDSQTGGEVLPFTNMTFDFEGTLDYIFFDNRSLSRIERLYVPTSHDELNWQQISRGHLLPSNIWPSDHLAIGAKLTLCKDNQAQEDSGTDSGLFCASVAASVASINNDEIPSPQLANLQVPPQNHGQRCACGCVPKVLSLFEMAQLRKQARLRRENQISD